MKPDKMMKVYAANGGALALTMPTYTSSQIESFLKCAVLLATLIYTALKCWKLARQKSSDDTIMFKKDDE